ncbi:hypothetical protein [Streptomyces sp. SID13726]|uniref:hypothetical protein n=1 Tax=Streptomyces sp. SID13726 TaxID=2706058 RepID=UPI0013B8AED9|nr:hypothetical protein [Streptomyces sp. SID13726]NEB00614.1 hypothetical protein [Streptomyces sp. SID13726]
MDRWDVLGLAGVLLLGGGLGLLAPWLGIASAGLVLLTVAVCGAVAAQGAAARERLAKAVEAAKGGEG